MHNKVMQINLSEKEQMPDNFNLSKSNFRYRNHLFNISFLLFQLVFCSMLLYYILRKTEVGMNMVENIFR